MRHHRSVRPPTHHWIVASAVRLVLGGVLVAMAGLATAGLAVAQAEGAVLVTEVRGVITPVAAEHLQDTVRAAEQRGAAAVVVQLDTPGGLVTSMRDIVQLFLNAEVAVIVHVAPRGADAGSAGTFITLAAHVAAMSPTTTIGAATPVDLEGGEVGGKVLNNAAAYAEAIAEARDRDVDFAVDSVREGRSITAAEALEIGVVDLLADDLAGLLEQVDGRRVTVAGDRVVTLATANAPVEEVPLDWTRRILQRLADPNVAFLLLSLSTLAIIYEVANPGVGAGGVTGAVSLILGLYGLAALPVDFAGVALLLIAAVLFTIEVFVPGIGVAAAGGTVALLLGGLLLFPTATGVAVDWAVLVPTVLFAAALAVLIGVAAARSRRTQGRGVADDLVGRTATVHGADGRRLRVRLDGTWWRVRPAGGMAELAEGTEVTVVDHDNLDLIVGPAQDRAPKDFPQRR